MFVLEEFQSLSRDGWLDHVDQMPWFFLLVSLVKKDHNSIFLVKIPVKKAATLNFTRLFYLSDFVLFLFVIVLVEMRVREIQYFERSKVIQKHNMVLKIFIK